MREVLPIVIARRIFATTLATVLPASDARVDVARLTLGGMTAAAFFLFTSPYFFPGGADHFTQYAQALADGTKLVPHLAQRDIGFPLLILLSGYTITGSFIAITLIHATFAVLMPLLVYAALFRLSRPVAFYTALCAIISIAPFYFMKWIHHDQTYIFFTMMTVALLACYLQTRRYAFLYLFTVAILAASVSRPAGNVLFPIFLAIAYVAVRGRIAHYLICGIIFVVVMLGYLKHRYDIFDMAHQPTIPSYTGQQIFYNAYMNSAEFGISLSPAIGPNLAALFESLYRAVQPSVKESAAVRGGTPGAPAEFMVEAFYRYTPEAFLQRAFRFPNWDYYNTLCSAEPNDQIFLKASLEIFRAYPWYPVLYTARNLGHLLAKPGYAHTRYNLNPFGPIGIDFPPEASGTGVEGTVRLRPAAQREVAFAPLAVVPQKVRNTFMSIRERWCDNYQTMVDITLTLMTIAWLGVAGRFALLRWRTTPRVSAWTDFVAADGLTASIVAASVLLLYNFGVTAAFAEPDYRYHHFMVLLRILISGYGLVLLGRLVRGYGGAGLAVSRDGPPLLKGLDALRADDGFAMAVLRYPRASLAGIGLAGAAVCASWAWFMVAHTR